MTLLLVFSDTHGDLVAAEKAISRFPQAAYILHLGDLTRDAARLEARHPEMSVLAVAGNCDFDMDSDRFPIERVLEIEGKRLLMVHGNRFGVKSGYERLVQRAERDNIDLSLFGHTHLAADIIRDGRHLLNPGSPAFPKGSEGATFALVEIGNGMIETRIMELDD